MSSPDTPLPHHEHPNESRASVILGVIPFLLVVAGTAVGLRVYTRAVIVKHFGIDDIFAVLSFVLIWACGFAVAFMTRYGLGKHIETLSPSTLQLYVRNFYVSIILYNAALMTIKMTFLTQYYRVLAVRGMRKVFIAAIVIVGAWTVSQVFVEIFPCIPIRGFWDKSVKASCIPTLPQWYINAAGNIITDFSILVLPLPVIGKLELPRPQKIILLAIFSLGFFTCGISLVRIKYLRQSIDLTWDNVESACWSVGEITSGITCACLPTLRPLVSKVWPSLRSHMSPSHYKKDRTDSTRTGSTATEVERGRTMVDDEEANRGRPSEMVVSPDSFHFGRSDSDAMSPESFHFGNERSPLSDDSTSAFPIMRPAPIRAMQPVRTIQRVRSMVGVGRRKSSVKNGIRVRFDITQTEKRGEKDSPSGSSDESQPKSQESDESQKKQQVEEKQPMGQAL